MELKDGYADLEQLYVDKGYVLSFTHIATGREVNFKGLITSFSDKYTSNWNETEVYGRMDPISGFKNTKRVIAITWDIVAAHADEAKVNMEKCSLLLTMLYPVYSGGNASSITTAPLLKVKFGNLIHNVGVKEGGDSSGIVGKVDGFDYTPNMNEQFFDVAENILYPQSITMTCNITVFHTHPLGWSLDKNPRNNKFPYGEIIKNQKGQENVKTTSGVTTNSGTKEQQKSQQSKMLTNNYTWNK